MASHLAVELDLEMLHVQGVAIADENTPDNALPSKKGRDVAKHHGRRYLLRYLLPAQVGQYAGGSSARHFVTPTPIRPSHTVQFLTLPAPSRPRTHVLLIDLDKVDLVLGPRRVRFGRGIEYILPNGFPPDAVVVGWEVEIV